MNNNHEKQRDQAMTNRQGEGSEYNRKHESDVLGYGDMDPNAEILSNVMNNTKQ